MKTQSLRFALYLCVAFLLAGCSGGHHKNSISVSLSGAPSTVTAGGAPVTITATVLNDSSNAGVTWTVTGGGTYTSTTTTLTYTPPPTVPSNPAVTIVATSITDTAASSTASFTIEAGTTTACQASPAIRGNEAALAGVAVAFLVKGADSTDAPIAYAGSVTFSTTAGGISAGLLDVVGFETGETGEQNVDLTTSSFSYGSDGRGCLYLGFNQDDRATHPVAARKRYVTKGIHAGRPVKLAANSKKQSRKLAAATTDTGAVVFSFVLLNPQGGPGRIEEFDNTTGTGTVAAGQMAVQDTDEFAAVGLAKTFAFGADGWAEAEGGGLNRVSVAGQLQNNGDGGLENGIADENIGGSVNFGAGAIPGPLTGGSGTLSGTVDASTGRGTGSYSSSNSENDITYDFAYYIIDDGDAFVISTDDPTDNGFMLSGRWLEAATTSATLSGYYLNSINGLDCTECGTTAGNNYVSVAAFSVLAGVPAGNDYINDAGDFSNNTFNGTYAFTASSGRTLFTNGALSNEVGYVTATASEDEIAAFTIGTDDNAGSGYIFTQSSTAPNFTDASLSGSFAFGSAEDVTGVNGSVVGAFTLDAAGNYTATIDEIFVGEASQPDTAASGTYSVSPNGLGNFDNTSVAFVTNGTLVVAIDASDGGQPLQYFLIQQPPTPAHAKAKKSHGTAPITTNVTPAAATASSRSTGSAFARPKSKRR